MKYLILTKGEYSDYTVDFLEIPSDCPLTQEEVIFLLNVDRWDNWEVAGEVIGEIKQWEPMQLESHVAAQINSLFCCFQNRPVATVLDKKRTKEELLDIAIQNDNSGTEYWKREVEDRYMIYTKAFDLYQRLMSQKQPFTTPKAS